MLLSSLLLLLLLLFPVLTHGLIPLNASDGGIEANEMRIKYYHMSDCLKSDDAGDLDPIGIPRG